MLSYNAECHCADCGILITITLNVIMLSLILLNVIMLNVIMLNVIMLNVIMLNVIMLNVIMLSVVAPLQFIFFYQSYNIAKFLVKRLDCLGVKTIARYS